MGRQRRNSRLPRGNQSAHKHRSSRGRRSTRGKANANPRGVLDVRLGGFGFVQTAEGEFFVPESKMRNAFNGDLVEVAPLPQQGLRGARAAGVGSGGLRGAGGAGGSRDAGERPVARVVRVLERSCESLVGTYEVAEPFGVVVPEDPRMRHDIFTMRADFPDVPDGALVRVRITQFPERGLAATGVIEEVIGSSEDTNLLIDLIIARHKLETAFSQASLEQAQAARLDVAGALAEGYRDLRERFVFTVDPADAKDFDDAVSIERLGDGAAIQTGGRAEAGPLDGLGGLSESATQVDARACSSSSLPVSDDVAPAVSGACWRLGVHIADVSAYVPWGSSIDLDARRRATSVYLVDRVIPMLPERLSNDLCSLRPDEDRLSMTVDIYLSRAGDALATDIYPAVIRSNARLSYEQAQRLLDGDDGDGRQGDSSELAWRLAALRGVAQQRITARRKRGGIEIDSVEAKVVLRADGTPVDVVLRRKTDATSLIEEAMILANEAVAAHLEELRFPCMYRVHEAPDSLSLEGLIPVLSEFPWFKKVDATRLVAGDCKQLARAVDEARGNPESELVSSLVLRSMKKAVYRPVNVGHYGLASKSYAHFTSPIRRYPDLIVHRMLKAERASRQGLKTPKFMEQRDALGWLGEHSSEMERIAAAAERDSQECKIAEFLASFVGQTFDAVISGVQTYGVYVRLENTAEGLLSVRDLGSEYFVFDSQRRRLTGSDSGKVFALGEPVRVVLVSSDPRTRNIAFKLAK